MNEPDKKVPPINPFHLVGATLVSAAIAGGLYLLGLPASTLAVVLAVVATAASFSWLRGRRRIAQLQELLAQASSTDALTGLLNRRAFGAEFEMELERSRRAARPLSVVIGDIDQFKEVNDLQSHASGDEALKRVAAALTHDGRKVDIAVRMGGEEFALLLPGTDETGAYMVAERMRATVEERFRNDPVPLTISFGISSYPAHGYDIEPLLHAADHALYTAKALGRNRSVICNRAIASAIGVEGEPDRQETLAPGEGRAAA